MSVKDHGPSIKNDEQYEALRDKGMSKVKAARISNSSTKESSKMTKSELIKNLRS